jgi:hypothetical protein
VLIPRIHPNAGRNGPLRAGDDATARRLNTIIPGQALAEAVAAVELAAAPLAALGSKNCVAPPSHARTTCSDKSSAVAC